MNKKKILVIEDNQDIRENIVELLELSGYTTLAAANGKEGVRMALNDGPNLILCDIMMPELDGYGVLHILGKHPETMNTPFVFLTAKSEKEDFRKGMTLGADDYITKPYQETDLLLAIENRLKKAENIQLVMTENEQLDELYEEKITKHFQTKEIVFSLGDSPAFVYYLHRGRIKLSKMNKDGKEVVVELCSSGDFFGYWSVLQDTSQSEIAETIEDSEVWMIQAEHFKKVVKKHAQWNSKFLKMLSKNLLLRENKILELAYDSVRKRVANSLVSLCDVYGDERNLSMKLPRELIASMAGTSVETAIRMLSEFRQDGWIETKGGEIKIAQYEKLRDAPY